MSQCFDILEVKAGYLGLGWQQDQITCLRLPESSEERAIRAVKKRQPSAQRMTVPPAFGNLVQRIANYWRGEKVDFSDIPVDLGEQDELFRQVYAYVRAIPYGEFSTYGQVASALGRGREVARDVGVAMATNPVPLIVPCHRVCAAGGKLGGFSAPGGSATKAAMLLIEGISPGVATKPDNQGRFDF